MDTKSMLTMSLLATQDLSAKQYYAVKISTTDKSCTLASASTEDAFPLLNEPKAGEAALVCVFGRTRAKIGGTITAKDRLGPDADGMLNVRTTAGDKYCAVALENGVDGDIIDVLVVPHSEV